MATITQLEYIVSVDKLRHFGKAADYCHVSQPSLSMQIQKVEDELGLIIFDRLKKPVLATEKGAKFIEQAKIILREHKKLIELTKRENREVSGEFRLAMIPTIAPYLLPLFIEHFSIHFPKVQLKVDELTTDQIIENLKNDDIDGAILATPLHETGIVERILYYEPFYLYVGKHHDFYLRKRIKEDELDGSDLWLLQDGHCLRNQVVKICSSRGEKGVFRNIQFEGGHLDTLRYLIKNSRGYTLVPELFMLALPENEIRDYIKEIEHPVPNREVSLVYRRDQWKSEILVALAESILQHLPKSLKQSLNKTKAQLIEI